MDLKNLLENYIKKVASSDVPQVQQQAANLQNRVVQLQEDENVVDADVQKEQPAMGQGNAELEPEDIMLQNSMPEMQLPDTDDSTFGKVSFMQVLKKKASNGNRVTLLSALETKYDRNNSRKITTKK